MAHKPLKRKLEQVIAEKYTVEKLMGEGGFCLVLKATDNTTNSVVAIKRAEKTKEIYKKYKNDEVDTKIKRMMLKEANIMKDLRHPNLMQLVELIDNAEGVFLVLEFAEGGHLLNRVMKKTKLSEKESRHIVKQLLSAVSYMHQSGYVHRDIKAENILFSEKNSYSKIIIGDFGLSRTLEDLMLTNCGTIAYSAPELIQSKMTKEGYTYKVDNWSIGIVTHLILTGLLPFDSYNQTEFEMKRRILSGQFSFNGKSWKKVSKPAKEFTAALLIYNPLSRLELKDAEEHYWILQTSKPKFNSLEIFPLMEKSLCCSIASYRWKILVYFSITVLHFLELCSNAKKELSKNVN